MGRSQVWDGTEWVSMTGGAGDGGGGGEPDDTYLRLDGSNNPASPNNYLRGTDLDGYLPLTGGTLSNYLIISMNATNALYFRRPDTPASDWYVGLNTASGLYFRYNAAAWMGLTPSGMDMQSHRIYALADAGSPTDAVSRGYADARYLQLSGGALTGSLYGQLIQATSLLVTDAFETSTGTDGNKVLGDANLGALAVRNIWQTSATPSGTIRKGDIWMHG